MPPGIKWVDSHFLEVFFKNVTIDGSVLSIGLFSLVLFGMFPEFE